jgi:hypothetical protein
LKKRFFETFSAENYIFSQHFLGKIFRGFFPEIFPEKKCTKNRPQEPILRSLNLQQQPWCCSGLGANPTTFEFTATPPALKKAGAFFKVDENSVRLLVAL